MEIKKIYASKYGQTVHTMKPQYEVRGDAVYRTIYHPLGGNAALPDFKIRGDKMYTTAHHEAGAQPNAWYTIKDGAIHNTGYHPEGVKARASFHLR